MEHALLSRYMLRLIANKVLPLVNIYKEDFGNKVVYRVYDNELFGYKNITKEEYDFLKRLEGYNKR